MSPDPAEERHPSRLAVTKAALAVGVSVLVMLAALTLATNRVSHLPRVIRWLHADTIARFEASRGIMEEQGIFESATERLLHDEIPSLRAGEPFLGMFGGSNVIQTLIRDELPEDLRERFHIVGAGACTGATLERLVRTLENEKGILRKGSVLIFGLWWGNLSDQELLDRMFLRYSAERWGLWTWGPDRLEPAGGLLRPALLEALDLHVFRRAFKDRLFAPVRELPPVPGPASPEDLKKRIREIVEEYDTLEVPGRSTASIERTLTLARDSGARVVVLEMPSPSWLRARPEQALWESWIVPTCERLGIPRQNLVDFLPDEEFYVDYIVHARVTGRRKVQSRLVQLVRDLNAGKISHPGD